MKESKQFSIFLRVEIACLVKMKNKKRRRYIFKMMTMISPKGIIIL